MRGSNIAAPDLVTQRTTCLVLLLLQLLLTSRCLVGREDLVEDVIVGLEALSGPVGAPRVQREELEGARSGHTPVRGAPQLQLYLHWTLNLGKKKKKYLVYLPVYSVCIFVNSCVICYNKENQKTL